LKDLFLFPATTAKASKSLPSGYCILGDKTQELLSGNPNAIHLLEKNQDKIDWRVLSRNPNAIHLLEKNPATVGFSISNTFFEFKIWVQ
jgi:hypothetical protein